jgi:hypothetical protein
MKIVSEIHISSNRCISSSNLDKSFCESSSVKGFLLRLSLIFGYEHTRTHTHATHIHKYTLRSTIKLLTRVNHNLSVVFLLSYNFKRLSYDILVTRIINIFIIESIFTRRFLIIFIMIIIPEHRLSAIFVQRFMFEYYFV